MLNTCSKHLPNLITSTKPVVFFRAVCWVSVSRITKKQNYKWTSTELVWMTGCLFFGGSMQQNLRLLPIGSSVNGYSARMCHDLLQLVLRLIIIIISDVRPWSECSTECHFQVSNCLLTDVTNGVDPQKKYFYAFSSSCCEADGLQA